MRQHDLTWTLIAFVCLLIGCTTVSEPVTVSYDSSAGATVYETDQMELHGVNLTSGLSRKAEMYMRVVGRCAGEECAPSKYSLIFGREGTEPVQITGRDVRLTIGSETMSWDDPQSRSVERTSTIRSGTFARVELTPQQLSTLASVSSVEGAVGDVGFNLPHEERAPLRTLLSRLSKTGEDGNSGGEV